MARTQRFTRLTAPDRRTALIKVALDCMAEGGTNGFTVDRVCTRAGVSRGLITHHFGGMTGFLAAIYADIFYREVPSHEALAQGESPLATLLDALFAPAHFNRPVLNIWLTLWALVANAPDLSAEHRRLFGSYRTLVAEALEERAAVTGKVIAAETVASGLIALSDGLGLMHCLDPEAMPLSVARQTCLDFLAAHLGQL
jgi:AcrR family transcriptional regulator